MDGGGAVNPVKRALTAIRGFFRAMNPVDAAWHDWDMILRDADEVRVVEPEADLWLSVEDWLRAEAAVLPPFYGGEQ